MARPVNLTLYYKRQMDAWEKSFRDIHSTLFGDRQKDFGAYSPAMKALQAGGRVIEETIKKEPVVAVGTQKKWWYKPYPRFWRYIYFRRSKKTGEMLFTPFSGLKRAMKKMAGSNKSGSIAWTKQIRPVGRLKKNVRVVATKRSNKDRKAVIVYIRRATKKSLWDRNNAWYAHMVEGGTKAGVHHVATFYGKGFYHSSVAKAKQKALDTVADMIQGFYARYRRPGNPANVTGATQARDAGGQFL